MRQGRERNQNWVSFKQCFSPVGIGVSNPFREFRSKCEKIAKDNKEIDKKNVFNHTYKHMLILKYHHY